MGNRVFDIKNIILLNIDEDDLNSFLVDMDIDDKGKALYQLDELTREIINVIPEYAFACYHNPDIPQTESVDKLREAAKSIYKIKEYELMRRWYMNNDNEALIELEKSSYKKRGEFGELLLHMLLRDFKETIPLISKVYFKDSMGVPAHGFDAVHVSPKDGMLWLGESKLYSDGKNGIDELLEDINHHIKRDYLDEQFIVIKKNLTNNSIPERDQWIEQLNKCSKLQDKIKTINIPLLCTYPHDIYNKFTNMTDPNAISYHEINIRELKSYFDKKNTHPLKNSLNIILMLFPIRDKNEFVKRLHERLWHMQEM